MRLICYATSGPPPRIVAAPLERAWMDETPQGYAYRCLPLNIANSHGWLILNPVPFTARWNGGIGLDSISIQPGSTDGPPTIASSHFGNGVLTFGVAGLFRTEPGYDLWVCGPVNMIKDGIQPLTGVVETDWSPFTFTMNYKFTRPFAPVSFGQDEPYCMIFPIRRGAVETIEPEFRTLGQDPDVLAAYTEWADSRRQFNEDLKITGSPAQQLKWQKEYFKGTGQWGKAPHDHRTKIRLKEFK
jgi:Family of unknown function (DUF6065)